MVPRLWQDNESRGWRGSRLGGGRPSSGGVHCQVSSAEGDGGHVRQSRALGRLHSVFRAKKHQQTIQAKVSVKEGASVKSQIYLPEMICVKQQSQRLLFFSLLLLLFFSVVAPTGPFHTEVAAKTLPSKSRGWECRPSPHLRSGSPITKRCCNRRRLPRRIISLESESGERRERQCALIRRVEEEEEEVLEEEGSDLRA